MKLTPREAVLRAAFILENAADEFPNPEDAVGSALNSINELARTLDDEGYPGIAHDLETLRSENERLRAVIEYCELSTRPDGHWADQAVNSFMKAALKGQ